ncbi:MAG: PAS domain S-box protein [Chloroflexi bacterium]|nr:PAS domain S-box protein [Chloroflexota bacterium]
MKRTSKKEKSSTSKPRASRPRTQAQPRTTSQQIVNILESISDSFVAFDAQMNYTYVNTHGGELLGRKPQDLIGKNYWTEYPEAKGTPFAEAYVRALETQMPIQFENYYAPFDRWFENRIYPSKEGLSIFFTDITERKQAQKTLQENEERFRALIENASDMIVTITADGKLSYVSPTIYRMSGYQLEEVIGKHIAKFIHPDDLPHALKSLVSRSQIPGLAPDPIELRFRRKDETWRVVEILGNNLLNHPAVGQIVFQLLQ